MSTQPHAIDFTNLDLFASGAPHSLFARLRREQPVHWNPEREGGGFWSLTRHADIVTASRDTATFSSSLRGLMIHDLTEDRPRMMIEMDPPDHTRYRSLVNRGFTSRMIGRLERVLRSHAGELLDRALARGSCDFVRNVAAQLPLRMIVELMGISPRKREAVLDLANRITGADDPEYGGRGGPPLDAMAEMFEVARRVAEEKRANPGADIVSELLRADIDGEELTDMEFQLFFLLLVTAGSETTRSAIIGAMLAFEEHPEQWERLRQDRSLLPRAIEEILRWTTPIQYFRRTARHDTELGGQRIREGDKVVLWYVSANRDEAVFPDPFRFDLSRDPNDHLSFGIGCHFCLGANLARLEMRAFFEEFLDRGIVLERSGPPERLRSNFLNTLKRMPVTLRRGA